MSSFDVSVLTFDVSVYIVDVMATEKNEPGPTIRAELGRRRTSVGRLAAATGMTRPRLKRRLDDPATFQLGELAAIATALTVTPGELLAGWLSESSHTDTPVEVSR